MKCKVYLSRMGTGRCRVAYKYGEELRPDQMSMSRTFEAVWTIPLQNPNEKEISCKSGMSLYSYQITCMRIRDGA